MYIITSGIYFTVYNYIRNILQTQNISEPFLRLNFCLPAIFKFVNCQQLAAKSFPSSILAWACYTLWTDPLYQINVPHLWHLGIWEIQLDLRLFMYCVPVSTFPPFYSLFSFYSVFPPFFTFPLFTKFSFLRFPSNWSKTIPAQYVTWTVDWSRREQKVIVITVFFVIIATITISTIINITIIINNIFITTIINNNIFPGHWIFPERWF